MEKLKKLLAVLIAAILFGCGGGSSSTSPSPPPAQEVLPPVFPPFTSVRSDLINPLEGTQTHPLNIAEDLCPYIVPKDVHGKFQNIGWQNWLCNKEVTMPTVYAKANSFNFSQDTYNTWIIAMSNEFIQTPGCNDGPPNQSRALYSGPFYIENQPGALTLQNDLINRTNNCDKIPYLSAAYVRGVQAGDPKRNLMTWDQSANYKLHVTLEHYRSTDDVAYAQLYIHYRDPKTGTRYMVLQQLVSPDTYAEPIIVNWNWPYVNSFQYPGAFIVVLPMKPSDSLPNVPGPQNLVFDLNTMALKGFPEFSSLKPDLLGVEFGTETAYSRSSVQLKLTNVQFK